VTDIKEQAESLRKQGMTYAQISSTLDGAVSVDWCKKNLSKVKGGTRQKIDPECVSKIVLLGERPQGILLYEANGIIKEYYPDANDHKLRYVREKAKDQSKNCIIHAGWIDHMKPNESHKAINAFALHLMDHIDLMVEDYMDAFPNANKWSVRYEMLKLALNKSISPESLNNRVWTNEQTAEDMETRYQ